MELWRKSWLLNLIPKAGYHLKKTKTNTDTNGARHLIYLYFLLYLIPIMWMEVFTCIRCHKHEVYTYFWMFWWHRGTLIHCTQFLNTTDRMACSYCSRPITCHIKTKNFCGHWLPANHTNSHFFIDLGTTRFESRYHLVGKVQILLGTGRVISVDILKVLSHCTQPYSFSGH